MKFQIYVSLVVNRKSHCSGSLPPANEVWEGYVFTGVCLSIGGSLSTGRVSVQGGLCHGDTSPVTVMCGWYASYWNAFLFH